MRLRSVAQIALSAWTAVAILFASLRTGWFGDDASYANLRYAVATGRVTILGAARASYDTWLTTNGRWYPGLVAEKYAAFGIFEDRFAYKAFLIAMTLAALAAAWLLLSELANSRFASLSILGTIACFQIRGYHDPFIAYNGMIQAVAICAFVSLSAFLRYVESGKQTALIASIAWYVVACATYEVAYLFAPLYFTVALARRDARRSLGATLPFAAIGFAFVALAVVLRARAGVDPASPYAIHPDAAAYGSALVDQVTAALPLSYLILNPSKIFLPFWLGFGIRPDPLAFVVAAACAFAVMHRAPIERLAPKLRGAMAGLGLSLVVLPALELPLLLKYQTELKPGLGYLPVLIEYFGIGILIALVARAAADSPRGRSALIVAFGIVAALSGGANEKLADILEVPYLASRDGFERALAHGLLATVPDGATLAIVPQFPWVCDDGRCIDDLNTSDVVAGLAHKRVRIVEPSAAAYVASRAAGSGTWSASRSGARTVSANPAAGRAR